MCFLSVLTNRDDHDDEHDETDLKEKMYKSRALLSVEVISNYRPRCHV